MKDYLLKDILCLALSKKKLPQKLAYIFQGIIFMPFLVYEERKQKQQGRNLSDGNQAGDDVYPLF